MRCAVTNCTNGGRLSRGWCRQHYDRWRKTGTTDARPPKPDLLTSVLSRTRPVGACLVWDGPTTDPDGRGQVRYKGRATRAHRVVWELVRGPIPAGQVIRHICDVSACLNIDHMLLGTQGDNMRDKMERGRGRWSMCRNGLHRLEGDNVYVLPSQPDYRECRACKQARNQRYAAKQARA